MKPLADAVEETGQYLAFFQALEDGVTVQQLVGYPYPPLTLGTVRALYALGADITRCAGLFTAEDLARAITGET